MPNNSQTAPEEGILDTEDYRMKNYPDHEGRKNCVWIENKEGEGMAISLDEIWKEHF